MSMRKENAPYNMHNSGDNPQGSSFEKGILDTQVFCKRPWGEGSTGGWWMGRAALLASWACGPPELLPSSRTMIQVQHVILELHVHHTHVQKRCIIASSLTVAFACMQPLASQTQQITD